MINWGDTVLRIASYTTSGSTAYLRFQSPESDILFVREYPTMGLTTTGKSQCFYLENALEFLDLPGEWYLDETADVLYYMPRAGEDMTRATVVAPMLQTLASVNGTSTADQAGYLWFQGLTFAHSTYLVPSQQGFLDLQAGQYSVTPTQANVQYVGRPAAGVTVTNANHIQFEGNMFTQMAATGLDFISGTHDDMILGNAFTDIGGSGISIGKFSNQGPASQMEYNYSHDFSPSQWADYQIGGLYLDQGTTGYTVSNNVFSNAPTSIFQNETGANDVTNNGGTSQTTISSVGLEPGYVNIKNVAIPIPTF
jgi:hypothetical protein